MFFDTPEVLLQKFTARYCKKKSIASIPLPELELWRKLTAKTEGRFIAEHMAPSRWSDSLGSLQTAAAVVGGYTPKALEPSEHFQASLSSLHRAIVYKKKREYVARHGDFEKQLMRNALPKK